MVVLSNYTIVKQKLPSSIDRCIDSPFYIKEVELYKDSLEALVSSFRECSGNSEYTLTAPTSKFHKDKIDAFYENLCEYGCEEKCVRCGSTNIFEYGLCYSCSKAIDWEDFDSIFEEEFDMTGVKQGEQGREITYVQRCIKAFKLYAGYGKFKKDVNYKIHLRRPFFP